jgi:NAD-dependent SIR2 family protein deacetylase
MPRGGFVYTSNVDGHFQRAGFDPEKVYEVHGAIAGMQCLSGCGVGIFSSESYTLSIDLETMRAIPPLPACPECGGMARPNVLMFGDWGWDSSHSDSQQQRLASWLSSIVGSRLVIVECGAGTAVPTVRFTCEDIAHRYRGKLIRVNVREADVPSGHISLAMSALAALRALDEMCDNRQVG